MSDRDAVSLFVVHPASHGMIDGGGWLVASSINKGDIDLNDTQLISAARTYTERASERARHRERDERWS